MLTASRDAGVDVRVTLDAGRHRVQVALAAEHALEVPSELERVQQ